MIYRKNGDNLEKFTGTWKHKELQIENLILSTITEEMPVLDEGIFGEELLFLSNQKNTDEKKRADIVALDKQGRAVIIELKKDEGKLGVETQALQYLSSFSNYRGSDFLKKFDSLENITLVENFIDNDVSVDDINNKSRIILMARYFDPALFSMGKWLADQGVSVRCISYTPIKIESQEFIDFSTVFDQLSSDFQYKLIFSNDTREPSNYWHNIAGNNQDWWDYLVKHNEIATGFDDQPGDRGEEILRNYVKGDIIFGYISKVGCVGYGIVEDSNYQLIKPDSKGDVAPKKGHLLHRKKIKWIHTIRSITDAITANEMKEKFGIAHPIMTSSRIKSGDINGLKELIKLKSNS